jgi:hypothetical protein
MDLNFFKKKTKNRQLKLDQQAKQIQQTKIISDLSEKLVQ